MYIKEIFEKPISRDIDGVIKADDLSKLNTEITEYVLTDQIQENLDDFFSYYNNPGSVNGAWISGFFGSGKSHLLKMLAYLLNNHVLDDGRTVKECFLPQIKESTLRGSIARACSVETQNILFNIDAQAQSVSNKNEQKSTDSGEQSSPILSVFLKMFNNACGYYGNLPHVAEFERTLDQDGKFQLFKENYKQVANQDWVKGRTQTQLKKALLKKAYELTYNTTVDNDFFEKYRSDFNYSIDDFAKIVKEYLDSKGRDFRLNFLVDEVGQFIAGKPQLLVNLQTIAENLQTKCKGRVWVIVTAQDELETTIGGMNQQQQRDFSKIQGRFKARIKLTSQDASEVIQRRLLQKKEGVVQDRLTELYNSEQNNFQTLFHFDGGYQYPAVYENQQQFINYYPFLPYQVSMFIDVITGLSARNAFEGRHSSIGERSLLSVFQTVGKEMEKQDKELGELASFDMLYAGIDKMVKTLVKKAIDKSASDWKHSNKDFEIQILKALFLVKYMEDGKFIATPENLAVLMRTSFSQSPALLKEKVASALNFLEQNICIKRIGNQYSYLTNEERDVEESIKHQEISSVSYNNFFDEILFGEILGSKNKIRYEKNKQDFEFGKRIDQNPIGSERKSLWIHFISPIAAPDCITSWRGAANQYDEVTIEIKPDKSLSDDVRKYLQTKSYCEAKLATASDSQKKILESKGNENKELKRSIVSQISAAIASAEIYINGESKGDLFTSSDPKTRIEAAFQTLVQVAYPNLEMVADRSWNEQTVIDILNADDNELIQAPLTEAENNVTRYIANQCGNEIRVTLKTLTDYYSNKPYGWMSWVCAGIVAKLIKRNQLEALSDGVTINKDELRARLTNTRNTDFIQLKPLSEILPQTIKKVKDFYHEMTGLSVSSSDVKTIGNALKQAFAELLDKIRAAYEKKAEFPFLSSLETPLELFKKWNDRPNVRAYFVEMKDPCRQELLNLKETVIDKILDFMDSPSRMNIYRNACQALNNAQINRDYLEKSLFTNIEAIVKDPKCYDSPAFMQLTDLTSALTQANSAKQYEARNKADRKGLQWLQTLENNPGYKSLPQDRQHYYHQLLEQQIRQVQTRTLIASINDFVANFENRNLNPILQNIYQELHPKKEVEWVNLTDVRPAFNKQQLESESDVDKYTEALNEALKRELSEGRFVQL